MRTALIQALVATIAESTDPVLPLNPYIIEANKWQATRHGLQGKFIDPTLPAGAKRIPLFDAARDLLAMVQPMSVRLGSQSYLQYVERIFAEGTGTDFMRYCYGKSHSLQLVVESLQGEFWK